jgi:hypothetical protein
MFIVAALVPWGLHACAFVSKLRVLFNGQIVE